MKRTEHETEKQTFIEEPVAKVCYAQMVKQFLSRTPSECVLCGGRPVYHRAECIRAEEKRAGYQSAEVYPRVVQDKCARESE